LRWLQISFRRSARECRAAAGRRVSVKFWPVVDPRDEVRQTIAVFRASAAAAIRAVADEVEIHAANGYVLHDIFAPNADERTDQYGGSIENRTRFALEETAAVADGSDRTGI
jgi:N-ethylmaleimide reductase